jgi:AraC-like DNA-binding protein
MTRPAVELERFVAAGTTPAQRFESWRSWFGAATGLQTYDLARLEPADEFDAAVDSLRVEDACLSDVRIGPSQGVYRTLDEAAWLWIVLFHRAPGFTGWWRDQATPVRRGGVYLFADFNGAWHAPGGYHALMLRLPRSCSSVDESRLRRWSGRPLPAGNPVLSTVVRPMLAGAVGRLEMLSEFPMVTEMRSRWVSAADLLLRSLVGGADEDDRAARIRRLHQVIDELMSDPDLSPDTVARAMHMSRRNLYKLLAPTGDGVSGVIRRRRLTRAREMLRRDVLGELAIADIGRAVGLPSSTHFSRVFKAAYGQTPSQYRAELRQAVGEVMRKPRAERQSRAAWLEAVAERRLSAAPCDRDVADACRSVHRP